MKKILSVFPVALIILALLTCGGEMMAQQQGGRDKANKEMNQAKQKGKEKAKEADEALQKEQEKARESMQKEEEQVREGMKDEVERAREAGQKEKERMQEASGQKKDEDRGRGNAYGRNKGGLEGRDFGQARAEEARMKHQQKKSELDRKLEDGEQRTVQARERIRVAREELEKEKRSERMPDDVYRQRKEKIDNAEKAVTELEQKIQRGKGLPGGEI